MKCPACGTRNNYYHRYCYFCGEKLGAMIDPPDQDDRVNPNYRNSSADFPSFETHDRDDSYPYRVQETARPDALASTPAREPAEVVEDGFDYYGNSADAAPYGSPPGYTPSGAPSVSYHEPGYGARQDTAHTFGDDPGMDTREYAASGDIDYFGTSGGDTPPVNDPIDEVQRDIAAKISSMEKYMDDYLSGRISKDTESGDDMFNDSLDFVRMENKPAASAVDAPVPQRPPVTPAPAPIKPVSPLSLVGRTVPSASAPPVPAMTPVTSAPPVRPRPPAVTTAPVPPPPASPVRQEPDPYEDEETSKMIDMLYRSNDAAAYPRRTHRNADVEEEVAAELAPDDSNPGGVIVKVLVSMVILAVIGFAFFVLYNEFFNPNNVRAVSSEKLVVTHTVEAATLDDGTTGQRLTLYINHGVSADIFGTNYPVTDDKVQEFFSDDFLDQQYSATEGATNNVFTATVVAYDAEGNTMSHAVEFTLSNPGVPLTILSPEGDTVEVTGNTCTLEIAVQPGARLFVNDVDYTDRVGEDGHATVDIDIAGGEQTLLTIRASMDGYRDAERQITVIPTVAEGDPESLLMLNESIPVSASSTQVPLTGQVPPGATIEASLPMVGDPTVNDSGAFSLTVQIPDRPGYSSCVLTVSLDGTQVDQKEVVIDKQSTFNEYTDGPWELTPYADYKASPGLHAGYRFKVPGKIKEIISQGNGRTEFTLDANPSGTEQPVRVWYWGDFSFAAGDSVTVYGNRWGNEEDVPRLLCKYVVSD